MPFEIGTCTGHLALYDIVRARLTSEAFMGAGEAWQEIISYDRTVSDPGNNYAKGCLLKNHGISGAEEIFISLEAARYASDTSRTGLFTNAVSAWLPANGVSWNGNSIRFAGNDRGAWFPVPNTGNSQRDALRYWLVANNYRFILAAHTEYELGGGQAYWLFNGYLKRYDPPTEYPAPHFVASPWMNPSNFPSYLDSGNCRMLGYYDSNYGWRRVLDPMFQNSAGSNTYTYKPGNLNPDGSHMIIPMIQSVGFNNWETYAGEVDGLYMTDNSMAHGDTFLIDGVTYVVLQHYLPGNYIALKLL